MILKAIIKHHKKQNNMKQIDSDIEINEDFIVNSNATYDIFFDGTELFQARLTDPENKKRLVGFEELPKTLNYELDKPMSDFSEDEKIVILKYRGLTLEDGFEPMDVFMEKSYTTLIPTKEEILEEMELHNNDEVGIDNQWTYADAEYYLRLSDKYYKS